MLQRHIKNENREMTFTDLFKALARPFKKPTQREAEDQLMAAFHVKLSTVENPDFLLQQLAEFTSSPSFRGEGDAAINPGYFAGLPYAPAFNLYFMRCVLAPNSIHSHYKRLIADINHYANDMYHNNPRKPDLDKLVIQKPAMTIGVTCYPPQDYIESVVCPYLQKLGLIKFLGPITEPGLAK
jgi:hypothetical protein